MAINSNKTIDQQLITKTVEYFLESLDHLQEKLDAEKAKSKYLKEELEYTKSMLSLERGKNSSLTAQLDLVKNIKNEEKTISIPAGLSGLFSSKKNPNERSSENLKNQKEEVEKENLVDSRYNN